MSQIDVIARGQHAQRLLDDELLQEAFAHVSTRIVMEWQGTGPADSATRESLWARLRALDEVQTSLRTFVQDAEIAMHERRHR